MNGEWGTVCDDDWDLNDATVVCKELGYSRAETYFTSSYFGGGTGDIWLDNVRCSGNEESLNDCAKNTIGEHNCGHDEDAGVRCIVEASAGAFSMTQACFEENQFRFKILFLPRFTFVLLNTLLFTSKPVQKINKHEVFYVGSSLRSAF